MRKSLLPALVCATLLLLAAAGSFMGPSTTPPLSRFPALDQPGPRLGSGGEDPVTALTRHGQVDGWRVDLIYSNPLLPRSQQNGEVIFKVFLTRIVPEAPPPDLVGGATLTSNQGLIEEGFTWELEETGADRVLGYLSCAVSTGQNGFINPDTRWIRVTLLDPERSPAIFEWNLDRLRRE